MNTAGRLLPPAIVYPRRNVQPHWSMNAIPDSYPCPAHWMADERDVHQVLIHFMNETGVTPERPHILVFDNHSSHVRLYVVTLARARGLISHPSSPLQSQDTASGRFLHGPFQDLFPRSSPRLAPS